MDDDDDEFQPPNRNIVFININTERLLGSELTLVRFYGNNNSFGCSHSAQLAFAVLHVFPDPEACLGRLETRKLFLIVSEIVNNEWLCAGNTIAEGTKSPFNRFYHRLLHSLFIEPHKSDT